MTQYCLSEIVDRVNSKVDRNNTDLKYYLAGEHIDGKRLTISRRGLIEGSTIGPMFYFGFKKGNVLLPSRSVASRKVAVAGFDGICSEKTFVLGTKDPSVLLPEYLPCILQSNKFWDYADTNLNGSVNEFLNWGALKDYELDLPPMAFQKSISSIVWKIEEEINLVEKRIGLLEEVIKSRFIEMFGDHTQLSRWPCCPVSDVCNVKVGVVIKPAQYYTSKGEGIKTFRSLNIGENKIIDKEWVYFSKEGNEANKRTILHKDDVIIARSGSPGVACVITDEYEGCNAVDVIIATPNTSKVNPDYLAFFTNFPHGKQQIVARGAAQQHFNVSAYEKVTLAIPSIELQNAFVEFAKQVDKSKFMLQKHIEQLKKIQQSLFDEEYIDNGVN